MPYLEAMFFTSARATFPVLDEGVIDSRPMFAGGKFYWAFTITVDPALADFGSYDLVITWDAYDTSTG